MSMFCWPRPLSPEAPPVPGDSDPDGSSSRLLPLDAAASCVATEGALSLVAQLHLKQLVVVDGSVGHQHRLLLPSVGEDNEVLIEGLPHSNTPSLPLSLLWMSAVRDGAGMPELSLRSV